MTTPQGQVPTNTPSGSADLTDTVCKALRRAWQLGQTYWEQADSESFVQNKKSETTHAAFVALLDDTRAALASAPAQPAGMTDDEKHLRRMLCAAHAGALAYMDDGEASDSRMHPTIDFLRDSPKDIQRKIWERNRAALAAAPAQPVAEPTNGTLPEREAIIRAAVAAMPHTNPLVADDLLTGHTMHTEAEDVIAIWKAGAASHGQAPAGVTGIQWQCGPQATGYGAQPDAGVLEDAARLDWLEEQAGKSSSGISFDWVKHVEDGYVTEKGYRFMRRHFLGDRMPTLREAIDAARAQQKGQSHE